MRAALLTPIAATLLAGCFYVDPINQRPAIDIRQTSDELVYRGSTVELYAENDDPEGHLVFEQWRVYLCTDATELADGSRPGCDDVPDETGVLDTITFNVDSTRADGVTPVQALRVILEAQDDYGAIARPDDRLTIPISDHAPSLDLTTRSRYGYVVNTPLDLFAKVGDIDDGPASTQPLTWTVYSPANQPAFDLVDIDVPDDDPKNFLQLGKRFTPKGVGEWEIEVTATDPLLVSTTKSLIINVVPDGAPCLAQWAPIDAPSGQTWPLTEPTLFRVNVVNDDLDPFPTVAGDAELGTTTFVWSIKQPGSATRDDLGVTTNQAALDPANYAPGDIVELRVEIADRNNTSIDCDQASPRCSVISQPSCIQRLTWRVEVR